MKRLYSKVRIALLTFTLGLAAVWMTNAFEVAWSEVPVDLPTAVSAEVLPIFPIEGRYVPAGGSGPCGARYMEEVEDRERRRSRKERRSRR